MSVFNTVVDGTYETLVENKCGRIVKGHEGSLMMVEVFFLDFYESDNHSHIHEQMTYCLDGEFDFFVDGNKEHIKTGDTIYFSSNVEHYCKVTTKNGRLLDVFTPIRQDFIK